MVDEPVKVPADPGGIQPPGEKLMVQIAVRRPQDLLVDLLQGNLRPQAVPVYLSQQQLQAPLGLAVKIFPDDRLHLGLPLVVGPKGEDPHAGIPLHHPALGLGAPPEHDKQVVRLQHPGLPEGLRGDPDAVVPEIGIQLQFVVKVVKQQRLGDPRRSGNFRHGSLGIGVFGKYPVAGVQDASLLLLLHLQKFLVHLLLR